MLAVLDSSFQLPSDAGLRQAKAEGIAGWCGYLATRTGTNLGAPWPKGNFDRIKAAGLLTMAYVSGYDDPAQVKAQAQAWGVVPCLDVEGGIRGDGPWVQSWLNVSGAGIYGNANVHYHTAPFHILAGYPGHDPKATWTGTKPNTPTGWQWQGTTSAYSCSVDRSWFDDAFTTLLGGGEDDLQADERQWLKQLYDWTKVLFEAPSDGGGSAAIQTLRHIQDVVDQHPAGGAALPQDVQDAIKALASHIH